MTPIAVEDTRPIHDWFGLSYAHYVVLPRSLLQAMPAAWQQRLVDLLAEMADTFDEGPGRVYAVQMRDEAGRFAHDPLADYRHPDWTYINSLRTPGTAPDAAGPEEGT